MTTRTARERRTGGSGDRLPLAEPEPRARSGLGLFGGLLLGYFLLIAAGIVALRANVGNVAGNEMGARRAVFTAVNAATLTGFQQDYGIDDFEENVAGKATLLALTLGGLALSFIGGGMAVVRVLGMPYTDRQIAATAGTVTVIAVLGGATALIERGRWVFDSVFLATSALANSGLYFGTLTSVSDWETHVVLLPLAVLGGLGLPVLMELFDRATSRDARGRPMSRHTSVVLGMTAAMYIGGLVVLALLQCAGGESAAPAWRDALAGASVMSVDARTLGLPFEPLGAYPPMAQWVVLLLMMIGGSPGGSAGGVKATTFAKLFGGVGDALRGRGGKVTRGFGIAAVWLGVYAVIVFAGLLMLLWSEPDVPGDRLLLLAVSAASNVGLAHDRVAFAESGLLFLSGIMLAGRIAPLLVLWWMARTTRGEDLAVG